MVTNKVIFTWEFKMAGKEVLTVAELQRELKICKNSAYDLVSTAGFPAIRIGRAIRIFRPAFEAWMSGRHAIDESTELVPGTSQVKGRQL